MIFTFGFFQFYYAEGVNILGFKRILIYIITLPYSCKKDRIGFYKLNTVFTKGKKPIRHKKPLKNEKFI